MSAIPTVPFDPNRHVLSVRETKEGRQEWCTLESLVAAERPLEVRHEAIALDAIRAEIDAIKNTPALPPDFEQRIVGLIQHHTPPVQLSEDTAAVLTGLTQAVIKLQQDHAETARRVEVLSASIIAVGEKLGV